MAGETMLIEEDEDQKGGKSQEVEFVPVTTKQGEEHDDEDDDHPEDSRLSEDNEDREEIRRKRREEKADRAARRKQAIERDKTELNFLRQRNESLEKRMFQVEKSVVGNTISTIDDRIADTFAEVKAAERIMAQAIEAGNGEDAAKAMRIRDQAMQKVQQLQVHKHQQNQVAQNLHQQAQQVQQIQAQPPGPDPEVASFAQDWVSKNSWYDPNAGDEASKIVLAIDQSLVESGYNPKTEAYWRELDKRVAKRLPDIKGGGNYDDSQDDDRRGQRRGPPVGSSRDQAPQSSRREVYISPERKQAMTDAGVWDDPVLRQRYLKQYAKWDREHNSTR
jgi:hypothetical protein